MRRDVFQAIADPIRRDIINLMASQDSMTPNNVSERFDVSRQAISKHLKILTECGLIVVNQKGRERFCTVKPGVLDEVEEWLNDFRMSWDSRFEKLDKLLIKLQTKKKSK